ncbi:uncharacterized protein LOC144629225 [Oculina patagonica]
MPKRSKKGSQESEREARPAELTLASFLTGSLASKTPNVSQSSQSSVEEAASYDLTDREESSATGSSLKQEETKNGTVGFSVKRTKKGKLPISYENRAKGKKVTVISNVSGDSALLLQELKKKIGAGGVVRGETVEIQGDHQVVVEKFLTGHPCLK